MKRFCFALMTLYNLNSFAQQNFICGNTLVDKRDGQEYSTVEISGKCWMAQNLNVGAMVLDNNMKDNSTVEKSCYENKEDNCIKYGGLYTWSEATTDQACPVGWHVPTKAEWEGLKEEFGEKDSGTKMKATNKDLVPWDGSNESGFTAIPAGNG